jgi:hypothetical protein
MILMGIKLAGLSGYALCWASAKNNGATEEQAHEYATVETNCGRSYETFMGRFNIGDNPPRRGQDFNLS